MSTRSVTLCVLLISLLVGMPQLALSQASDTFEVSQIVTGLPDTVSPTVPANLSATAISTTQINLTWSVSTDNVGVAGYQVFRDGVFVATSTLTNYSDIGLTPSTSYDYTVTAFDAVFNISTSSATATATTLSPDTSSGGTSQRTTKIINVVIVPEETQALVTWRTNFPVVTRLSWGLTQDYEIGELSEVSAKTLHSAKLGGLIPGIRYYIKIVASGASGRTENTFRGSFVTKFAFDTIPPGSVIEFEAVGRENDIALSWTNPPDPDLESIRIVRSDKFFPRTPFAGKVVFEGIDRGTIDKDVLPGVTYYYSAFARDTSGNYAAPAIDSARVGEGVRDPFEEFSEAPDVPSGIKDLTLSDFDFAQDGRSISFLGSTVPVDGSKQLSISIDYDKLLEVLKTIGVTLTDPDDPSKKFSFLLRVNKEKTRYIATLAPLSRGGRYDFTATVFDFRNQRLTKFNGELIVSETEAVTEPRTVETPMLIFWILISLLIILFIFKHTRYQEQ